MATQKNGKSNTRKVSAGGKSVSLADAAGDGQIVVEDAIEFGDLDKQKVLSTFAAHFVVPDRRADPQPALAQPGAVHAAAVAPGGAGAGPGPLRPAAH